jgi:hypothetical protein
VVSAAPPKPRKSGLHRDLARKSARRGSATRRQRLTIA